MLVFLHLREFSNFRAFSGSLTGRYWAPFTMPDWDHFSQFQEKIPFLTEIPFAYKIETNKQETI
jgi:hypothetical protein